MNKRFLLFAAAVLATSATVQGKVRLPHLLSDGMVIQQNADAHLWGWASPRKTVTVTTSWSNQKVEAKAGKDGKFILSVKTPAASFTPYTITFNDGDGDVAINDVLVGDVWVCAGQSNMEMPVKGFNGCPVKDVNNVIADAANNRGLRWCKIPSLMRMKPLEDTQCRWLPSDVQNVREESAVGYFFGRMLSRTVNIPIGLIEANKGGTRVESWLNEENLKKYTDEKLDTMSIVNNPNTRDYERTLVWGNGTFAPILNSTVKGIIYYQGEGNVGYHNSDYAFRLSKLVEQWRQSFGNVPFYFVQIAPYDYGPGTAAAKLREQQQKALDLIPNSGIVGTNDLVYPYEKNQIHPSQKRQVGERLAFLALNHDYGMKGIMCENPKFDKMEIVGDTCFIKLKDDYNGVSRYSDMQGFEVAGADKVFHKAEASHYWQEGNNPHNEWIAVISKDVKTPVAVRYCFKSFQLGNVGNQASLPLLPFRTDNW